jgi:hypothetical protein
MARNPIQFQAGLSLTEFFDRYGTEEQCREALFAKAKNLGWDGCRHVQTPFCLV